MFTRQQWLWAAALFVLTLVARLPVRWVAPLLPAVAHCVEPSGTVWSGRCARAGSAPFALTDISWTLQPWLLFTGRLGAQVRSGDPNAPLSAALRFSPGGRLDVRDLQGSVAIGSGLLPLFPEGWSGTLAADVPVAEFRAGAPQRIRGVLTVAGLRRRAPGGELGSYELRFDERDSGAGDIGATLRDTSGPLAVAARLQLSRDGAYELAGTVLARGSADSDLAAAVAALGAADASGRRQFSLAGSF
jgi:general secretion pathway protein N